MCGEGVLQTVLYLPHLLSRGLVEQVAEAVEIPDGRDTRQGVGCGGPHGGILRCEQGEHLVRSGSDPAGGRQFERVNLRGGGAVERREHAFVHIAVERQQRSARLCGVRAVEAGDQGFQGLRTADLPGSADRRRGQFVVVGADHRHDGVGLRGGMACTEPVHDVRAGLFGQRGHLPDDSGVERLVGEVAGEVERRAAVLPVAVPEGGEQVLRALFDIRPENDLQGGGADVRARRGLRQRTGCGEGALRVAFVGEAVHQPDVGARGVGLAEIVVRSGGRIGQRPERALAAAGGQGVVNCLFRGVVGLVVGQPREEDLLGSLARTFRGGIGQQGRRPRGVLHQRENGLLASGRRDEAPHGRVGQVVVVRIFHEYRNVLFGGADLEQREQECLVGLVRAGGDSFGQPFADLGAGRVEPFAGHVVGHAVQGVLHDGVLPLVGGHEHAGHLPDARGAGRCQFPHEAVIDFGGLGRELRQCIGDDGRGGALPGVLRPCGQRQEAGGEQYDEYFLHGVHVLDVTDQIFHGARIGWSISRLAVSSPTKSCFAGSKRSVRLSRSAQRAMFTSVALW